jgi:integration host factor subunit beta
VIKSELIEKLVKRQHHLSEKDVTLAVGKVIEKITKHLSQKGRVEIRDFGCLNLHYRNARTAHNPKTGQKIETNAKHAIHFKPGKAMRERVNESAARCPIRDIPDDHE